MAIHHASSGEVVNLLLGRDLPTAQTTTVVKTDQLEVLRLVVPAGKDIPRHQVSESITVQCLEGRVIFTTGEKDQELSAGQFMYLAGGEPHALRGVEDSSLLVTIWLGK